MWLFRILELTSFTEGELLCSHSFTQSVCLVCDCVTVSPPGGCSIDNERSERDASLCWIIVQCRNPFLSCNRDVESIISINFCILKGSRPGLLSVSSSLLGCSHSGVNRRRRDWLLIIVGRDEDQHLWLSLRSLCSPINIHYGINAVCECSNQNTWPRNV